MKVSIIIPVFNVEKHLEKCIDSVLSQTYGNIEILLIDDGSTDKSGEICDSYLRMDNRVRVYHKENGGPSSARNYGIKKATGDYITFIDSDDFIDRLYIEVLIMIAKQNDSDLVISELKNIYENGIFNEIPKERTCYILTKQETLRKTLMQEDIDVNATAKLYNSKLFRKLKFPEGKLYEDFQIIDKTIENSNNIVWTKYQGYYYAQRKGSIMYGKMSKERMILIEAANNLLKKIQVYYPDIIYAAERRFVYCNFHILGRAIMDEKYIEETKTLRKNILKYKKQILFRKYYTIKEKLATIMLLLGIDIYKKFWIFYCRYTKKEIE